jgi:ectoine hydroxylase-related dioxygenase (phytanoyl-CoA dioxygenase family)
MMGDDSTTNESVHSKFLTYWTFSLTNEHADEENSSLFPLVPSDVKESFVSDGYAVFPKVLTQSFVDELNIHLEEVLRGRFDRSAKPDKMPKILKNEYRKPTELSTKDDSHVQNSEPSSLALERRTSANRKPKKVSFAKGPLGFSGNRNNVKVLQVINVHKADSLFRKLAESPVLGYIVAQLAGWTDVGTRLAQDQVWAKPPGAPPLTFHRDSPYFMFSNPHVVTVWVALDDMDDESIGPLQYVKGSHKWGDGRVGSANQFFDDHGGTHLLESAAECAGHSGPLEVESMIGLLAGGISIHDGRTWHGSGPNLTKNRPRRGLGLHFVPANVRFTTEANKSRLWKRFIESNVLSPQDIELSDDDFPITWRPTQGLSFS